LPEVGGDAALYFDPYDVEAMAEVIRAVWLDADLWEHQQGLGLNRATEFSWDRTARETAEVYDAVLSQRIGTAGVQ
jgi:glycosyltransferase involved in cell wall biosynthesis